MLPFPSISDIVKGLLSLFKEGSTLVRERGVQRDAALDSIYMVCTETKIYVTDWNRTNRRSRKNERELARLWKKASLLVRAFDPELANKCYFKGEYWLDPDNWIEEDTRRLQIDLDRVIIEAKELKVMDDAEYEMYRLRKRSTEADVVEDTGSG